MSTNHCDKSVSGDHEWNDMVVNVTAAAPDTRTRVCVHCGLVYIEAPSYSAASNAAATVVWPDFIPNVGATS